jgi:hypothetical protein
MLEGVDMDENDARSCFFCMKVTSAMCLSLGKEFVWPAPIPKGTVFVCCEDCAKLPADVKARHVIQYCNTLRIAANRAVIRSN